MSEMNAVLIEPVGWTWCEAGWMPVWRGAVGSLNSPAFIATGGVAEVDGPMTPEAIEWAQGVRKVIGDPPPLDLEAPLWPEGDERAEMSAAGRRNLSRIWRSATVALLNAARPPGDQSTLTALATIRGDALRLPCEWAALTLLARFAAERAGVSGKNAMQILGPLAEASLAEEER